MKADTPQQPVDPNLAAEQKQADATLVAGLQSQAQMDTASLMTRFGTRLALSGSGMAPIAPAAAAPVVKF